MLQRFIYQINAVHLTFLFIKVSWKKKLYICSSHKRYEAPQLCSTLVIIRNVWKIIIL